MLIICSGVLEITNYWKFNLSKVYVYKVMAHRTGGQDVTIIIGELKNGLKSFFVLELLSLYSLNEKLPLAISPIRTQI